MKFLSAYSKIISIVVGLLFFVIGLLAFFNYDPAAYDAKTTGTITEINERYESIGVDDEISYDVYIDYTVGDKKYEHIEYFEYHTGMNVGDTVEFFYMSSDPTQIAGSDKDNGPYIGLAFAVVGFIILVVSVIRIIRRK